MDGFALRPVVVAPTFNNVSTLGDVVADIAGRYPRLAPRLRDEHGGPYPFVTFYLNDEDIRFRSGFSTPVREGDEITVVAAIAGG